MEQRYNTRSPAVKRLMKEAQELSEPTDQYYAQPLDDNLFEWHFTVRGPADSDFQNGIYHGRIILPVDYPMKPPSIIWLTPNGRFETNKKICLSISGHHPESWQPSWSIRTALLAIIGFMPTRPGGAIGSLDYKPEERKVLAKRSREWQCPTCGDIKAILLEPSPESSSTSQEAKDLAAQINFQGERSKCKEENPGPCAVAPSSAEVRASSTTSQTSQAHSTEPDTRQTSTPTPATPLAAAAFPNLPAHHYMPWAGPLTSPPPSYVSATGVQGSTQQSMVSMMPRFPFPPSHYPAGYMAPPFCPPGFGLPPGMGGLPYPYPPPGFPAGGPSGSKQTSAPTYTRSPMTTRQVTGTTQPQQPPSSSLPAVSAADNEARTSMMAELLQNVKRVGSDSQNEAVPETQSGTCRASAAVCGVGLDQQKAEEDQVGDTTSDLSQSGKKTSQATDLSAHNDLEVDENSEHDAPPISETEQRSLLEKSLSGSTSGLDRRRGTTPSPNMGLRQRQSATARIQQDPQEGSAPVGGSERRQRIEAASGDTRPWRQERLNLAANRLATRQREVLDEVSAQNSPFDFSLAVMVILSIGAMVILINRLRIHIDWGDFFEDEFTP